MIWKRFKFGKTEDVTLIEYGFGTTVNTIINGIRGSREEGDPYKGLVIKSGVPSPIGKDLGRDKSVDEFEPEVVMLFYNEESLDVILGYLTKIKKKFEEERLKEELKTSKKLIIRVDKDKEINK